MNDQSKFAEPKDPRVEAALHEYLERVDRGEPVDREEFLARHAPIAEQLRSFIAAEEDVRKLAAAQTETPHDQAHDSTKSFVGQGQETVVPQLMAKRNVVRGLEGRFGRYRIIRALGKGAMGTVYLAEDTQIERQVALKTPHFTEDPTGEQMERFFREARAAGNLRHPNICPIYDFGQIDGKHYISMAYIEGRPLSAYIQPDKPQSERQILIVIRKLALALQEAHDHGIVHRDLKPANIMVDKKGEPTIMDFGLARQTRREDDIRLTQTGDIIGTPAYMSPEQVEGEPEKIGSPTDQYSLGVILYELLTRQLPFRGSVMAVMGQILTKEVTPPSQSRPDLDPRIEAVCLKMMAKPALQRFASLKAVADELAGILKNPAAKPKQEDTGGQTARATESPAGQSSADRLRADASASQALKSFKPKSLTESDLASLEELARKCLARRDYEQTIQIVERIPEEQRNARLVALFENARAKADEITFLIVDIDEAERLNDAQTALKKAEALLKVKPGHHRALEVREKYSRPGEGGAARIGVLDQFRRPLNDRGWIPWSVLAFGLAVFGVMTGVIVIYLGRTAVVIDIQDLGVEVAVKGTTLTVTGPDKQSVKVEPGDQELKITSAGLETITKSFTLKKGEKRTVTVSILDKKLVAWLDNEIAPPTRGHEEQSSSPTAGGKSASSPPTPAHKEQTTAALPPTFKNSIGMEFVLVPKGKSWLGGGGGQTGDKEVVIDQDFYLGKYEVTQAEWAAVTGRNRGFFRRGKNEVLNVSDADLTRFPVEHVSWLDAQDFLERLNMEAKEAGWVYRLPKEVEWEYACRGGPLSDKVESASYFYFDKPTNQLLPEQANFKSGKGPNRTCKVGSYPPNRLGLYDMHGNVCEWCDDADTRMENGAHCRVNRGGGWYSPSKNCEAASRDARAPWVPRHFRNDHGIGFRVARVPVGKEKEIVKIPAEEKQPAVAVVVTSPVGPKPNVATAAPKISSRPFLVRGEWRIENDELVQPTLATGEFGPVLAFGEATLSNYDLNLEAKKTGGRGPLGICFHWLGPGHYRSFLLAWNGWLNSEHAYNGKWGRDNAISLKYSSNRWYSLKVEVRGDTFRAYLDGVLQFEQTDARFTNGRMCLFTDIAAARFRRIKVSDPQGNVLFEGLPDLLPASNKTIPKANIGHSSRSLTAEETAAKSAQKQWAERLKAAVISTNSLGIKLALIPPGEFQMGSPISESQRNGNEQQHRVRITKPFSLGVYEITQSEFEQVMGRNPSWFSNTGGPAEAATGVDTSRNPVEQVSWYDAIEFCNKLSEKEGRRPYYRIADIERETDGSIKDAEVSVEGGGGYCLPTEAQCEYACRAGTTTPFNFGIANNGAECNCNGKLPYGTEEQSPAPGRTVPVGSYRPNAFGLYDMHGNVNEWCWDMFDPAYYTHSPESDPAASSGGSMRGTSGRSLARGRRELPRGAACWRLAGRPVSRPRLPRGPQFRGVNSPEAQLEDRSPIRRVPHLK